MNTFQQNRSFAMNTFRKYSFSCTHRLPYKLLGKACKRRIALWVYLVIQLHGRFLPSSSNLRNKKASNTTAGDIAKKIV